MKKSYVIIELDRRGRSCEQVAAFWDSCSVCTGTSVRSTILKKSIKNLSPVRPNSSDSIGSRRSRSRDFLLSFRNQRPLSQINHPIFQLFIRFKGKLTRQINILVNPNPQSETVCGLLEKLLQNSHPASEEVI